jgi:hypothetical protein
VSCRTRVDLTTFVVTPKDSIDLLFNYSSYFQLIKAKTFLINITIKMVNTSDIFIAGIKSSQIWEKTVEKKKQTQKDSDCEIEVLIEENPEGEEDVENVYG